MKNDFTPMVPISKDKIVAFPPELDPNKVYRDKIKEMEWTCPFCHSEGALVDDVETKRDWCDYKNRHPKLYNLFPYHKHYHGRRNVYDCLQCGGKWRGDWHFEDIFEEGYRDDEEIGFRVMISILTLLTCIAIFVFAVL